MTQCMYEYTMYLFEYTMYLFEVCSHLLWELPESISCQTQFPHPVDLPQPRHIEE